MINYISSLTSTEVVALTIYGEARNQQIQGQIAVGCVIRNRALAKKATYEEICLAPKQFSSWNEGDPNRVILDEMAQKLINGQFLDDIHYEQALWIAEGITESKLIDNTAGARYFLTTDLFFSSKKPSWAAHVINAKTIGNHIFFSIAGEK